MYFEGVFCPIHKLDKLLLLAIFPQSEKYGDVSENAQWPSGGAVVSWFASADRLLKVSRYSPRGILSALGCMIIKMLKKY